VVPETRNQLPFCDGSHKAAGFAATGEPATGDTTALAVRDGVLHVRPQKNGPLAVSGAIEVLSGTGRTILRADAAMLCRCGQSRNKPYCDGSHLAAGFRAD
jgi:CDGSH-type Zn-finger protein